MPIFEFLLSRPELNLFSSDNPSNETPLHWAVSNDQKDILPLVLAQYKKHDMDLDIKDINGHTPMFLAAVKGYKACFQLLLEAAGEYSNVQDIEGDTILHWLINMHETRFVTEILRNVEGVNVKMKNSKGVGPLVLAASKSTSELNYRQRVYRDCR